jgi:hypothetical protein
MAAAAGQDGSRVGYLAVVTGTASLPQPSPLRACSQVVRSCHPRASRDGRQRYAAVIHGQGKHPLSCGFVELDRDFWLLDDETDQPVAQLMTYDPDGQYVSREVTSDPAVIARCRAQRDLALARSVDLKEFLRETGERLR